MPSAEPAADAATGRRRRKPIFVAVCLLAPFALAEVVAYVTVAHTLAGKSLVDFGDNLDAALRDAPDSRMLRAYVDNYDSQLGWVNKPDTKSWYMPDASYDHRGARAAKRSFPTTRISSYGDSFTHGDWVAAEQTWTHLLGEKFGTNALNYGVGGYGTDQALLRAEIHCKQGLATDVIVLGIMAENINRTMSVVRGFYTGHPQIMYPSNGPKPFFHFNGESWELQPIGAAPTAENARADLERAKRLDWWYEPIGFPYSISYARYVLGRRYLRPREVGGVWNLPQAATRMEHILRRFAALSQTHRFHPVVVFIPGLDEFEKLRDGKSPNYKPFLERVRSQPELQSIVWVDVLQDGVLRPEYDGYGDHPEIKYAGHPTVAGHRILAEAIAARIAPLLSSSQAGGAAQETAARAQPSAGR